MTSLLSPVKSRPEGKFSSPEKKFNTPSKSQEPVAPTKEAETLPGPAIKHLYRVIQKSSGAVGGYGHNGPVYGEITMGTFQKVVNAMVKHTGFDASSSFVDIGSGLGKPSLHVALNPGVQLSCGIEVEELRWQLSMHNLRFVMAQVPEMRKNVVYFAHADATEIDLHDFTHIYMFDVGFPPNVLNSLADAFNRSKSAKALVSFQRPDKIRNCGFAVKLATQILTRMNGSTEGHTAYIFTKDATGGVQSRLNFPVTPAKTPVKGKSLPEEDLANKDEIIKVTETSSPKKTQKPKREAAKKKISDLDAKLTALEAKMKALDLKTNALDRIRKMDYGTYVAETGLVGVPGARTQRAAAAVRKNYKY